MRAAAALLALSMVSHPIFAQATGTVVRAALKESEVAVSLVQRADYIVQTLIISSNDEDQGRRYRDISAARKKVLDALAESKQVSIIEAPATVSSSGEVASSGDAEPSAARIDILLPILDNEQDIFEGALEIVELVKTLHIDGSVGLALSPANLAVDSPEKYRGRIIEKIYKEASAYRQRMRGLGRIIIEGLEGPVQVRQVDNLHVELYLNYRLVFEVP